MEEQVQRARMLIQTKRYAEAREILKTIDHPKAREWLQKIDGILRSAPERPSVSVRAALVYAAELIEKRHYTQALEVLTPIDHPKADELREKIRIKSAALPSIEIFHEQPISTDNRASTRRDAKKKPAFSETSKSISLMLAIISTIALLICIPAVFTMNQYSVSLGGGLVVDLTLVLGLLALVLIAGFHPKLQNNMLLISVVVFFACAYVFTNWMNAAPRYYNNGHVSFTYTNAWVETSTEGIPQCNVTQNFVCEVVLDRWVTNSGVAIVIFSIRSPNVTDLATMNATYRYLQSSDGEVLLDQQEWQTTISGYPAIGRTYKMQDSASSFEFYVLDYLVVPYPGLLYVINFAATDAEARELMTPDVNTVKETMVIYQ